MKFFIKSILLMTLALSSGIASEELDFETNQFDMQSYQELVNAGLVITGTKVVENETNGLYKIIFTSSDRCCYHRAADGTCLHPNPACNGCICYHQTPNGCVHCSCGPGKCP